MILYAKAKYNNKGHYSLKNIYVYYLSESFNKNKRQKY